MRSLEHPLSKALLDRYMQVFRQILRFFDTPQADAANDMPADTRRALVKDALQAPGWMRPVVLQIAAA